MTDQEWNYKRAPDTITKVSPRIDCEIDNLINYICCYAREEFKYTIRPDVVALIVGLNDEMYTVAYNIARVKDEIMADSSVAEHIISILTDTTPRMRSAITSAFPVLKEMTVEIIKQHKRLCQLIKSEEV